MRIPFRNGGGSAPAVLITDVGQEQRGDDAHDALSLLKSRGIFYRVDGTKSTWLRDVLMRMFSRIFAALWPAAALPDVPISLPVDHSALADFVRILHEIEIEEQIDGLDEI